MKIIYIWVFYRMNKKIFINKISIKFYLKSKIIIIQLILINNNYYYLYFYKNIIN